MLALTFHRSIPAFAIVKASGGRPDVATSALSMLKLGDVPEPELPARNWVRVLPTLSGICGSDLAAIGGHASLYLDPLTSYPFVPGHEVVGTLDDGSRIYFTFARKPWGSMCERTVAPRSRCLPVPAGLDDNQAAAIANPGMS